jgi:hypothetical protein
MFPFPEQGTEISSLRRQWLKEKIFSLLILALLSTKVMNADLTAYFLKPQALKGRNIRLPEPLF